MDYDLNLTEAEAAHAAEMREMLEANELVLSDRDYIDAINIDAAHGIWFND